MMTMGQQQAMPGEQAPVPQVVASYVSYLQSKTELIPVIPIREDDASVMVSTEDKELVLTFQFGAWGMGIAEGCSP